METQFDPPLKKKYILSNKQEEAWLQEYSPFFHVHKLGSQNLTTCCRFSLRRNLRPCMRSYVDHMRSCMDHIWASMGQVMITRTCIRTHWYTLTWFDLTEAVVLGNEAQSEQEHCAGERWVYEFACNAIFERWTSSRNPKTCKIRLHRSNRGSAWQLRLLRTFAGSYRCKSVHLEAARPTQKSPKKPPTPVQ